MMNQSSRMERAQAQNLRIGFWRPYDNCSSEPQIQETPAPASSELKLLLQVCRQNMG
jgi:hypothetical protein